MILMGFLSGLLKVGTGALNATGKVAGAVGAASGKVARKTGGVLLRGGHKVANSRAFVKTASPKKAENLSFIDKKFQEAVGLAKEGADGAMQYKTVTGMGFAAMAAVPMLGSTGRAVTEMGNQSARGMVSVADNMERFISYDGSGFVNNVDDVAGGDPAILNDIVNHTFASQRSTFSDNSLNDIVFALHANREG
jgi:hypothetical protein